MYCAPNSCVCRSVFGHGLLIHARAEPAEVVAASDCRVSAPPEKDHSAAWGNRGEGEALVTRDLSIILPGADWRDCFEGKVDDMRPHSLDVARRLLDHPPAWISGLMALRNTIVAVFGLKTVALAAGESAGGFPVISSSPERTVLGFDDRHLDFRIVVDLEERTGGTLVRVTTLVRRKNLFGRMYLLAVGPFHRRIVPATMRPFCRDVRPALV
ncbi:DUF2867 domain-containing protein [Agrobacterium cavarae]|uniref:DUF2867 domain-containing protein n=1 Tax=Agrobacterium cavarae TaxID=2528239 RepID=A0ABY1YFZ2_9HYPH|nr:DUF2867 domain-containing protein [Agrobacterium cavarae]